MVGRMLPIQVSKLDELGKFGIMRIVAAIGVFDGIHLGHRKIISELLKMSDVCSAVPVLVTFFPHPRRVLYPDKPQRFLRSPFKKAEILRELGIEVIVTVPFSLEFASLPPNEFIEEFMHPHNVKLAGICVGKKWKFGAKAQGNEKILHDFADKCGFMFKAVEEVCWNSKIVSSTAIRSALAKGDFLSAVHMLDRRYVISGHAVNRGKDNVVKIQIDYGILPPKGLYEAYINNGNIVTPTKVLSDSNLTIDSKGKFIIGKELNIEFVNKINN